jgi:hypothetical protein
MRISGDCANCPVALACRDAGLGEVVTVNGTTVETHPDYKIYRLPLEVRQWIRNFDASSLREVVYNGHEFAIPGKPQPIEFELEGPVR